MTVISVDPGEHIGVARWSDIGDLEFNETLGVEEYMDWLMLGSHYGTLLAVVMEDYRLRQGKQLAQTGSRLITSQVIGITRFYAHMRRAPLVLQDSQILRITAMHADIKLPTGHIKDKLSAFLHGYYFFESQGLLHPKERTW